MLNGNRRSGVSMVLLVAVGTLAAVSLQNAAPAAASTRTDFLHNSPVSQSERTAYSVEGASAQTLRDSVPASLFPVVTQALQSNGPTGKYRVTPIPSDEPGYQLFNPAHFVSAHFGARAVRIASGKSGEWVWSLELAGYGRGQAVGPAVEAKLTAAGNRIEYTYPDGVTQWFVNGPLEVRTKTPSARSN